MKISELLREYQTGKVSSTTTIFNDLCEEFKPMLAEVTAKVIELSKIGPSFTPDNSDNNDKVINDLLEEDARLRVLQLFIEALTKASADETDASIRQSVTNYIKLYARKLV